MRPCSRKSALNRATPSSTSPRGDVAPDICYRTCNASCGATTHQERITAMHASANDDELWRRLDWNDVRTFLAVAESGSLNAAGRMLNMTQSTISRRMEDLEYRLGATLFQRSTRGITLTEAGETVRELAASMARLGGSIIRDVAGRDRT